MSAASLTEHSANRPHCGRRHATVNTAKWQLLTRTAATFLAIIFRLVDVVFHPLYCVAVDNRHILVRDVDDLVNMQHDAVQQGAHCRLDILAVCSTRLQVRQTGNTPTNVFHLTTPASLRGPGFNNSCYSLCFLFSQLTCLELLQVRAWVLLKYSPTVKHMETTREGFLQTRLLSVAQPLVLRVYNSQAPVLSLTWKYGHLHA